MRGQHMHKYYIYKLQNHQFIDLLMQFACTQFICIFIYLFSIYFSLFLCEICKLHQFNWNASNKSELEPLQF